MAGGDPDIDLTRFDFPTDKLTVKDLRRLFPGRLDHRDVSPDDPFKDDSVYEKLAALIAEERGIATHVYDQARGRVSEFGLRGDDLKEAIKELGVEYLKFGLASGPAQAREFARSVERQALRQAGRHGGKIR
jgi:hypothetical protein